MITRAAIGGAAVAPSLVSSVHHLEEVPVPTRREFLKASAAAALSPLLWACRPIPLPTSEATWVEDAHSQLARTRVGRVITPDSLAAVRSAVREARSRNVALCVAGARHAAGAQQFAADAVLMDMTSMNRVVAFDPAQGEIEAEAGIRWPELEAYLRRAQGIGPGGWAVAQRQGVPIMSLGGTLSANAHGDGLNLKPVVGNVESFVLETRGVRCDVAAATRIRSCSASPLADMACSAR